MATQRQFARDLSTIGALPQSRVAVREPLYRRAAGQFGAGEAQRELQGQQIGGRLQQQRFDIAFGKKVEGIAEKQGKRAIGLGVTNIALKGGLGYANIMADRKSRRQWQNEMDKYNTFIEAIYQSGKEQVGALGGITPPLSPPLPPRVQGRDF